MGTERDTWKSGDLLAYTERDGPGPPTAASPTWMIATLVGVVGVTFAGVLTSDTLCPEHRVWVQALALVGFVAIGASIVSLVRGTAAAPVLTLFACSMGLAIGLLDAAHSPTRGLLVALGFGVALALAAVATMRAVRLMRWDHRGDAEAHDVDAPAPVQAPITPTTPEEVGEAEAPVGADTER